MKAVEMALLIADGKPQVSVDIGSNAHPALEFAADELKRNLHLVAGGRMIRHLPSPATAVEIRLSPGSAPASLSAQARQARSWHGDAFAIEAGRGCVKITGATPRGAIYGVYELLDRLGCRWLSPDVARIPTLSDAALPAMQQLFAPAFEFRDILCPDVADPLWQVRNRMNGFFSRVPSYMGGHHSYGLFVHTFYWCAPPAELFAKHPEYFSLVGGKRKGEGAQLCLSNKQLVKVVAERLVKFMRANPHHNIFSVSQNDWEGMCECPECVKLVKATGAQSGAIIHFANEVAKLTSREFPHNLIDTLAYSYSFAAPVNIKVHPNVRVRLCSINCCQAHGFGDCGHEKSLQFRAALENWSRLTSQLYIWHYTTNFSHHPLPLPNFEEIESNLRLYLDKGVHGVFFQGAGERNYVESGELRSWLSAKLMWNPMLSVWKLADEWLRLFYGPAATEVSKYYKLFHDRVRKNRDIHPLCYDSPNAPLYGSKVLEQAEKSLSRAQKLCAVAEARRGMELLRGSVSYAQLFRAAKPRKIEGNVYHGCGPAVLKKLEVTAQTYVRHEVGGLSESGVLEDDLLRLRQRLSTLKVFWLKAGGHRLAIVPDAGGRIVEWWFDGRQWLNPPDINNTFMNYPCSGGYTEYAIGGVYEWLAYNRSFSISSKGQEAKLGGDVGRGFYMERTIKLNSQGFSVDSRLINKGSSARKVNWQSGLHLLAADWINLEVAGMKDALTRESLQDGMDNAQSLKMPDAARVSWRCDAGRYLVEGNARGRRFDVLVVGRDAKGALAVDLRSERLELASGEAYTASQRFCCRRK